MIKGTLAYSDKGVLHTIEFPGKNTKRYTGVPLMNTPAWHPDGHLIAFGRHDVFLLNTETQKVENLTRSNAYDGDPSWSPDGNHLVFARISKDRGLYVLNLVEQKYQPIQLTGNEPSFQPTWSGDGKYIAFTRTIEGRHHIFRIDTNNLTTQEKHPVQLTDENTSFWSDWHPIEPKIVFSRKDMGYWKIFTMDADGGHLTQLTNSNTDDFASTWSPDGEYIAFERYDGDSYNIFVMRPDGSDIQQITESGGRQPTWWMAK